MQRMTRRGVAPEPEPVREVPIRPMKKVIARYPHHAWHCDLTTIPTAIGFWTPSSPFGLTQRWPFCWWLVVLADQFSAKILGVAVFPKQPTTGEVRALLNRAVTEVGVAPDYLITDKGHQFRDRQLRGWCRESGIRHRFGALGQFGSIPFIERLIRTIKDECTTRLMFPYSWRSARKELRLYADWYNGVRPHERLHGDTPEEVHDRVPRVERANLRLGDQSALRVRFVDGRKHLPIVALERAA